MRPAITQQILLQKQPRDLDEAIKAATAVEYALNFGKGDEPSVHVVQTQHDDRIKELHTLLQQMKHNSVLQRRKRYHRIQERDVFQDRDLHHNVAMGVASMDTGNRTAHWHVSVTAVGRLGILKRSVR